MKDIKIRPINLPSDEVYKDLIYKIFENKPKGLNLWQEKPFLSPMECEIFSEGYNFPSRYLEMKLNITFIEEDELFVNYISCRGNYSGNTDTKGEPRRDFVLKSSIHPEHENKLRLFNNFAEKSVSLLTSKYSPKDRYYFDLEIIHGDGSVLILKDILPIEFETPREKLSSDIGGRRININNKDTIIIYDENTPLLKYFSKGSIRFFVGSFSIIQGNNNDTN